MLALGGMYTRIGMGLCNGRWSHRLLAAIKVLTQQKAALAAGEQDINLLVTCPDLGYLPDLLSSHLFHT